MFALKLTGMMGQKYTMEISNVPGPRRPLVFDGSKSIKTGFLVTARGKLSSGLSFLTHCDVMQAGFMSD